MQTESGWYQNEEIKKMAENRIALFDKAIQEKDKNEGNGKEESQILLKSGLNKEP